jgi:hypothetical protein
MAGCGRFEGIGERVIAGRSLEEVSIGDYVHSCPSPRSVFARLKRFRFDVSSSLREPTEALSRHVERRIELRRKVLERD